MRTAEAECLLVASRQIYPDADKALEPRRLYSAGSNVIGLGDTVSAGRG